MRTTKTAEPAKANQNGAVTPHCRASRPPTPAPSTRPPYTPIRFTLPTRPWRRGGHGPLTHGDRGGAPDEGVRAEDEEDRHRHPRDGRQREREVGEGLDDQADPHQVAEAHPRGDPAVRRRRDQPAGRPAGRQQPEADLAEAETAQRVEHQHGPRGAEGDVEDEDREHQGPYGGVVQHPPHALDDVVPDAVGAPRSHGRAAAARPALTSSDAQRPSRRPARRTATPCRPRRAPRRSAGRPAG